MVGSIGEGVAGQGSNPGGTNDLWNQKKVPRWLPVNHCCAVLFPEAGDGVDWPYVLMTGFEAFSP